MESKYGFTKLSTDELPAWLDKQKTGRAVTRVQLHHTWSPSYKHFTGANHFARQQAMKEAHLARDFSDIAQHFTIFPDGALVTGRPLSKAPAGIVGGNTGAVCIECFGNFDRGGDAMTDLQADAIVQTVAVLCKHFGLDPAKAVTYHAWWTADGKYLGDYSPARSAKSCPGTAFFGGSTRAAYNKNLLPRITAAMKGEDDMIVYKKPADVPAWGRPTVDKLIRHGSIKPEPDGSVNLSSDLLRMLVINDREGLYK